jgi:hypothetical protein
MCFSAPASFASGTVLATVGVICLKKKQDRSQTMLSAIPLIFSVQQFTEGFVWLLLDDPDQGSLQAAINIFLFFALVVWPSWVPLSILAIETKPVRRTLLGLLATVGVLISLLSVYYLFAYRSGVEVKAFHLRYILDAPAEIIGLLGIVYLTVTIIPLFLCSVPKVPLLGFLILFSHLITIGFFSDNVLSVWCFFSALMSVLIYIIVTDKAAFRRSHHTFHHERNSTLS